MRIVFVTNYYNHHQSSLAEALDRLTGHSFTFISTGKMREDRKMLGYGNWKVPDYVIDASESEQEKERAKRIIAESEVLIVGSAPAEYYAPFLTNDKVVFIYTERPFKKGIPHMKLPILFLKWHVRYSGDNIFLLAAGAYTYSDYAKLRLFNGKAFKWGYFPRVINYDTERLFSQKDTTKILWCGRLIDWKHPDSMIGVAEKLRNLGYRFSVDIIGTGEMEEHLRNMIVDKDLAGYVHLLGAMPPEEVRKHMEKAGIFTLTSDRQEGWGAVLNEAMNSCCAVVASDGAGAVPYLISNECSGLQYSSGDEQNLTALIRKLLDEPQLQKQLGQEAYRKIITEWNADVAATRLLDSIGVINTDGAAIELFEDGPCSRC